MHPLLENQHLGEEIGAGGRPTQPDVDLQVYEVFDGVGYGAGGEERDHGVEEEVVVAEEGAGVVESEGAAEGGGEEGEG